MTEQTTPDYTGMQHRLWETETEILDVIHRVCTENGLKYSLAYGTLLGAVRHQGFIPWDDDVDVMMPREDYEKLKTIWAEAAPSGFLLQDEDLYDDYVNNYAKVRKDHTTFLQFESERTAGYQTGIYVDVFPADRAAPTKLGRAVQYALCAVNLLFNRGYTSGTGGIIGFAEKLLLKLVPKKSYRKFSLWAGGRSRRWNERMELPLIFPCTIKSCRKHYPADLFEGLRGIAFQGNTYLAVKDPDAVLTMNYGDYMQLPPEEERVWKHHPLLVDFERNYDEL